MQRHAHDSDHTCSVFKFKHWNIKTALNYFTPKVIKIKILSELCSVLFDESEGGERNEMK